MADGLSAPFAGEHAVEHLQGPRVESVLVSEDEIADGMRSSTGARSSHASLPRRSASQRCWPEKCTVEPHDTVVVVVSGGNVAAEIASAILG